MVVGGDPLWDTSGELVLAREFKFKLTVNLCVTCYLEAQNFNQSAEFADLRSSYWF